MRAMERIGILVGVFAFTMATIYGVLDVVDRASASSGSASSASSSAGCSA